MIIDKLENIDKYSQIPTYVVEFLKTLNSKDFGKYILNDNEFVNIESYMTKKVSDAKFEKHDKYIDIQLLIEGNERIYIKHSDKLKKPLEYNSDKDIMFYGDSIIDSDYVTLDGTNFVLINPYEAHAPQVSICENCKKVKKAVVKLLF